jgi:hypothetical protein
MRHAWYKSMAEILKCQSPTAVRMYWKGVTFAKAGGLQEQQRPLACGWHRRVALALR